jgi:hypothetical protein
VMGLDVLLVVAVNPCLYDKCHSNLMIVFTTAYVPLPVY